MIEMNFEEAGRGEFLKDPVFLILFFSQEGGNVLQWILEQWCVGHCWIYGFKRFLFAYELWYAW